MVEPPAGTKRAMSVLKQGRYYLLIGILQWLLDWGVMVALSHGGLSVEPANVAGRISGALLGFWLNGRITFSGDQHHLGRKQFARFVAMWLGTTAISTWSMGAIDDGFGLQGHGWPSPWWKAYWVWPASCCRGIGSTSNSLRQLVDPGLPGSAKIKKRRHWAGVLVMRVERSLSA